MRSNPYRMMRGASFGGAATNYAALSLYNNSSGPDLLLVWYALLFLSTGDSAGARSIQGAQGTLITSATSPKGGVAPIVSGEAPRPGQLYYVDAAATPAFDVFVPASLTGEQNSGRRPLAVLQPGWSFQLFPDTTGKGWNGTILWESVHAEDLIEGNHCPICDVTIALK